MMVIRILLMISSKEELAVVYNEGSKR